MKLHHQYDYKIINFIIYWSTDILTNWDDFIYLIYKFFHHEKEYKILIYKVILLSCKIEQEYIVNKILSCILTNLIYYDNYKNIIKFLSYINDIIEFNLFIWYENTIKMKNLCIFNKIQKYFIKSDIVFNDFNS